jgi:acyl carrier protein
LFANRKRTCANPSFDDFIRTQDETSRNFVPDCARNQSLASSLQTQTGLLRAADALDIMAEALAGPLALRQHPPLLTIAALDWENAAARLTLLRSPTYGALAPTGVQAGDAMDKVDVGALIAELAPDVARSKVQSAITARLAPVLHARAEDISTRSLAEIGLDSLMALELAKGLEETFSMAIPLGAGTAELTVASLSDVIIRQAARSSGASSANAVRTVATHHSTNAEAAEIIEAVVGGFPTGAAVKPVRLLS